MKIRTLVALVALLGFAQPENAAAQERGEGARRQSQNTERTQEARQKKKAQDAERARRAREQEAEGTRKAREQEAQRTRKAREGARDDVQRVNLTRRATGERAEDRRAVGAQNEAERAKQARQDAADKEAERTRNAREGANEQRDERAANVREEREKERIENARGDANAKRADRAGNARAAEARAQKAKVVQDMTRRVAEHKKRMAEISRLEAIFQGRGDEQKLRRVQALKKTESETYAKVMQRYETLLGDDDFKAVRGRLRADQSPAPAPTTPARRGR